MHGGIADNKDRVNAIDLVPILVEQTVCFDVRLLFLDHVLLTAIYNAATPNGHYQWLQAAPENNDLTIQHIGDGMVCGICDDGIIIYVYNGLLRCSFRFPHQFLENFRQLKFHQDLIRS